MWIEESRTPEPKDVAIAKTNLEPLDEIPLYARVDMVRGDHGDLLLMELELIEPFLYPLQGYALSQLIHDAFRRKLN